MKTYETQKGSSTSSTGGLGGALRRRRATILVTLLVFVGFAAAVSSLTTPMYRSSTEILLEDVPRQGAVDPSDPMVEVGARDTAESVGTQIEMLQSGDVLRAALDQIGFPMPRTAEAGAKLPRIRADRLADTNAVVLSVDAESPEPACKLAEELPAAFSRYLQTKHEDTVSRALAFLQMRERDESTALAQATSKLTEFNVGDHGAEMTNEAATATPAGPQNVSGGSDKTQAPHGLSQVTRSQKELSRRVAEHENALLRLDDLSDRIRLRDNSLNTPVVVITQPGPPIQVAPDLPGSIVAAIILGLLFGCLFALWRDAALGHARLEPPAAEGAG